LKFSLLENIITCLLAIRKVKLATGTQILPQLGVLNIIVQMLKWGLK